MEGQQSSSCPSANWRVVLEDNIIPVIAGCTASGKTSAALRIASIIPGVEIVSADSRQLYRGMNIGTAKPSSSELALVPHHMIDIADPDVLLSAGFYAEKAIKIIDDILSGGGIPLVVGGSALYIMSLAGLFNDLPKRSDPLRKALGEIEKHVPGALHRLLACMDPAEADTLSAADTVRLVRSLEIAILSGDLPSDLKTGGHADARFRFAVIETDNTTLRRRIETRTSQMLQAGFVDEVRSLLEAGYGKEPVLGSTIGYAEIIELLQGNGSLKETEDSISVNTWKYARRQRNMFRRLPGAVKVDSDPDRIIEVLFKERISHG